MSESNKILNAGTKAAVHVVNGGRFKEIDSPYPPVIDQSPLRVFLQNLTLNGDGITSDMRVDGSATPQDFYIESSEGFDTYITSIAFLISAENAAITFNEFANLPALTNGCQLIYESKETGQIIIADQIRTNFDILKMCRFKPSFGTTDPYKLVNAIEGAILPQSFLGVLQFNDYGIELEYTGGIVLKAGQRERLIFRINDNITGASTTDILAFDALAYGNTVEV
jgi:hypothetical protein